MSVGAKRHFTLYPSWMPRMRVWATRPICFRPLDFPPGVVTTVDSFLHNAQVELEWLLNDIEAKNAVFNTVLCSLVKEKITSCSCKPTTQSQDWRQWERQTPKPIVLYCWLKIKESWGNPTDLLNEEQSGPPLPEREWSTPPANQSKYLLPPSSWNIMQNAKSKTSKL